MPHVQITALKQKAESGQGPVVLDLARQYFQQNPGDIPALCVYGLCAFSGRSKPDIATAFEALNKLDSANAAETLKYWAKALSSIGDASIALQLVQKVLTIPGHGTEANLSLAKDMALAALNMSALKWCCDQAGQHFPDSELEHLSKAEWHLRKGDIERAKLHARAALERNSLSVPAFFLLSDVAPECIPDENQEAMKSANARGNLSSMDRSYSSFAMGQKAEHDQRFEEAEKHYREANKTLKSLFASKGRKFDSNLARALIGWAQNLDIKDKYPEEESGYIFIVGMPRCGSTLLEQMLGRHSRIETRGETGLPAGLFEQAFATRNESSVAKLGDLYSRQIGAAGPSKMLVDKTLSNFQYAGPLLEIFPQARIIDLQRSAPDTCLSIYLRPFNIGHPYSTDIWDTAAAYAAYREAMDMWKEAYPDRILTVDYEALVSNSKAVLRTVLKYLDLDWEEAVLEPEKAENTVLSMSAHQVRKPVYKKSIGRAKKFPGLYKELSEALEAAGVSGSSRSRN